MVFYLNLLLSAVFGICIFIDSHLQVKDLVIVIALSSISLLLLRLGKVQLAQYLTIVLLFIICTIIGSRSTNVLAGSAFCQVISSVTLLITGDKRFTMLTCLMSLILNYIHCKHLVNLLDTN